MCVHGPAIIRARWNRVKQGAWRPTGMWRYSAKTQPTWSLGTERRDPETARLHEHAVDGQLCGPYATYAHGDASRRAGASLDARRRLTREHVWRSRLWSRRGRGAEGP